MNRCKISQPLLIKLKTFLKTGKGNAKTRNWVEKWNPTLKGNNVYQSDKLLVPLEQQQDILELASKRGMPLGRDSAFKWLSERYFGFKRRDVAKFIDSLETVQMMRKRPFKNTKTNETQVREGTSQVLLSSRHGGHGSVGIDLVFLPRQTKHFKKEAWTEYKYLYVAVVQSNNFTFAYPMESKTAKAARNCAAKLWKDFRERYGFDITGIFMDKGTEFQEDHRTFWKSNGINPKILKKVWWTENRISTLMRNIAALREGLKYSWRYAFQHGLNKTNATYSRKIKAAPSDITGEQLQKGIKHFNRKLKRIPKKRKQPKFEIGDKVRTLTKNAMDPNTVLWKSYNAFRDSKTQAWSKTVHKIKDKKKKGRTMTYFTSNDWYYPWQLQKIDKVLVIQSDEISRPKSPKKSALTMWLKAPKKNNAPKKNPAPKRVSKKNPAPKKNTAPKRVSKKVSKPRRRRKLALRAAMAKPLSRKPQTFALNRPVQSWASIWGRG